MAKANPSINWTTGEVHLIGTSIPQHNEPEVLKQCYLLQYLGAMGQHNPELAARVHAQQRNQASLRRILGERHPHIWKLTLSMALAQAAGKIEQKLPPQYAKYAKVFNEPKDRELPPRWLFDHGIDLKDTFIPKVAKSFPMNPKELEACKEFIDENLKASKIRKSQSPQALPFFFVQKKDGGLQPCQDY